ncbi:MAG: hypothetical protein HYU28_09015 [Actinobacteria bacterium]|nr:hypothetical protein [Actinomycetota bacterium]
MNRHGLDVTSLIAGLVFVGLGAAFLSDAVTGFNLQVRWVWPSLLLGLGFAFLLSGARRGEGGGDDGEAPLGIDS